MLDTPFRANGQTEKNITTVHENPHRWVRRWVKRLLAVAIVFASAAILLQLVLAIRLAPLLCGTAAFTSILLIPLLMRTVLHPEIEVSTEGLLLRPMLLPAQFIHWQLLIETLDHPLVHNDPAIGRLLHGKNYHLREGLVIVVDPQSRLWLIYRLVGNLAGAGNRPAFAISNTTHTDYEILLEAIRAHLNEIGSSVE